MAPKGRKEKRVIKEAIKKPVMEKVPFIPMLSRILDLDQVTTNEISTCLGATCSVSFPALSTPNGTVIPCVAYYNHCFHCPGMSGE